FYDRFAVTRAGGSCVVDEDVDRSEAIECLAHECGDLIGIANVADRRQRLPASLHYLLGDLLDVAPAHFAFLDRKGRRIAAGAHDDHVRSLAGQLQRGRTTDAAQAP